MLNENENGLPAPRLSMPTISGNYKERFKASDASDEAIYKVNIMNGQESLFSQVCMRNFVRVDTNDDNDYTESGENIK